MLATINSSQDSQILAMSVLKAFADNNFDVAQMVQSIFDRIENIFK